jgi:hypothetical protein
MENSLGIYRCSHCNSRFVEGEMVGVDELDGRQNVLCCLCLDLRTSRLGVVCRMNGRIEIRVPNEAEIPRRKHRAV